MLSRFRRITTGSSYVPEIDGIRFLAITFVFIFHLAGDILRHSPESYRHTLNGNGLFWATQRMNFGVQMFFVLSGLVLALPFARSYLKSAGSVSLRRYFLRRLTRLEPPYITALIILFFLKLAAGRGSLSGLVPHFGASAFYLHNLIYNKPSDINFVAWSLEIEVQFYVCAPILSAVFYSIRPQSLRRLTLVLCCFGSGILSLLPYDLSLSLVGQLPYFLGGLLLADLFVDDPDPTARSGQGSKLWDVGFLLSVPLVLLELQSGRWTIFAAPLTVSFAYFAAFHSNWIRSLLRLMLVSTIGGMCYSIYLLHNYVIAIAGMLTENLSSGLPFSVRLVIQSLLIAPTVLVVCGAFYVLIEQPCMRPDWPARLRGWLSNSILASRRVTATAGAE